MNAYADQLKRTACLLVKDEQLAEDIVQDSFIKLYYHIHQFKGKSKISTYLYSVIINECRQCMRRNWFKKVIVFGRLYQETMDEGVEKKTTDRLTLTQCLYKLNSKDRELIILYYYQDIPIEQISKILGRKEGTIKSRLKRARDKLKPYLEEAGFNV